MKKHLVAILFASAALVPLVSADTLMLSFYRHSTNNLFQNSLAEAEQISALQASWEKSLSPFSLFVDGGYSFLRRNPGLSYGSLIGGADYLLSMNEKTAFYLSLAGGGVLFRSGYSDFNYSDLRLSAAVKSYLRPTSIIKADAISEYRKYKVSLFDFVSQSLHVSLDKFFESKTTFKADMNWGYKYFLHPIDVQAPSSGMSGSDSGMGGGMMSGTQPGTGMGTGPGMGSSMGHGIYFMPGTAQGGRGIQIISASGLIAQGLGDNLGIRVTGARQWTLSGENPFTSIAEFYGVENPTYDLFSWNGTILNGQVTAELPWNIGMKIGYTLSDKEFPGIESLGSTGTAAGMTRKDKRRQLELRLEKNFSKVSLFLLYSTIDNRSNDAFFAWKGYSISGGLEWNLAFGKSR
jgi:hypothetical protein